MAERQLTESEGRAIESIVRGKRAWSDESELIKAGVGVETLVELAALGWLAIWVLPKDLGRAWTLTPWAAERLRVWTYEYWEYVTTLEPDKDGEGAKARRRRRRRKSTDCLSNEITELLGEAAPYEVKRARDAKKPAMLRISNVVEIPRWAPEPPPREPGMPKPPKVPVVLPKRIHECQLPQWMSASWVAPDEDPVREMLDGENWLMTEALASDGTPVIDEKTGEVQRARLVIQGMEIPRAKAERKRGKGSKRKRKGKGKKRKASDKEAGEAPNDGDSGRPAA